jgi:nitrogen PTS system EIIA component
MQISDILAPESVVCGVALSSKKVVIERLAEMVAGINPSISTGTVYDRLLERERLGSTGLGRGVAIPHGRLENCEMAIGAFLFLESPVDFDAIDSQPVDLIFALLVPQECNDEHLKILAQLAEKFSNEAFVAELRSQGSAVEIHKMLTS